MKRWLVLILAFCSLLLLMQGSVPLEEVLGQALMKINGNYSGWNPLLDERVPRLIVILCTGSSLALSGAVMQGLFQNPLASPSVLGTSLGGSLGVLILFISGLHLHYPFTLALAAFIGSLTLLGAVFFLNRGNEGTHSLILIGLALTTFLLAVEGALLFMLRDRYSLIQLWMEWGSGSFADRSWSHVHQQLPLTLFGLIGCLKYRKEINLLSLGDEEALNLGVDVDRVRWRLFLFVSLLMAGSLAAAGIIPFFGLIMPHIVRRFVGANHQVLLPISCFAGALFLLLMELFLKTFSISILSIGQLSAFFGGLFYLTLLVRPHAYRRTA